MSKMSEFSYCITNAPFCTFRLVDSGLTHRKINKQPENVKVCSTELINKYVKI